MDSEHNMDNMKSTTGWNVFTTHMTEGAGLTCGAGVSISVKSAKVLDASSSHCISGIVEFRIFF